MKPPKFYRGGGPIKGDPKNPAKTSIDRTKYQSVLSQPMTGTGTNMVSSNAGGLSPDVLKVNGYNLVSGMGKDAIWEKGGNYHLYNEQLNAPENKYGLINIGNPLAPKPMKGAAPASVAPPAIDPNRKPLDLSNPSFNFDPNNNKYFNKTSGAEIKPITQQFAGGGTINYNERIDLVNQKNQAQQQGKAQRNNGNPKLGQAAQTLGAGAMTLGSNALQNVAPEQDPQTQGINSTVDATAASLTPWYGLAKGASDFGRSKIKRDQYGNPISSTGKATDDLLTPMHQNVMESYKREGVGGAAKEVLGGAGGIRAASNLFGKGDQTTGFWGKLNKYSGLTSKNQAANDQAAADQAAQAAAAAAAKQQVTSGRLSEAMARRDAGITEYTDNYYEQPDQQKETPLNRKQVFANLNNLAERSGTQSNGLIKDTWRSLGKGFKKAFADGGKITGSGTGKSDSINAKVKPGSFVVPVENAELAEELREQVLDSGKKKAKLKQKSGVDVKLSNGEVLFDPNEKKELEANGIDLGALAPKANIGHETITDEQQDLRQDAKANGGPTPYKAHEMLKDGTAHGKGLTPKQKRYFGWIYGQSKAEGGEVEEYAKGGPVNPPSRAKAAALRSMAQKQKAATGKAPRATVNPGPKPYHNDIFSRDWAAQDPNITVPIATTAAKEKANPYATASTVAGTDPNQASYDKDMAEAMARNPEKKGFNSQVGNAIDYGIPLLQAGLGLRYLNKAGARPVDKLDSDYLHSIDTARGNVVTANANAKFGFSPSEQASIDMQNNQLTQSGLQSARNYSGGSSAGAFNLSRATLNDSFQRGLGAKAQNRNLIFQKQGIAQDRQQYLDSLIAGKVNMSNRLFNQKLDAWQQQQAAGSNLLGAAAQNFLGNRQWQAELEASKNRQQMYNPQYPNIQ